MRPLRSNPTPRARRAVVVGACVCAGAALVLALAAGRSGLRAVPRQRAAQREPLRTITSGSHVDFDLSVSADRRVLAFTNEDGHDGLFVASLDGTFHVDKAPVDEAWPTRPVVSPDGSRVFYEGPGEDLDEAAAAVRIFDRSTGTARVIVRAGEGESFAHAPAWSPDGHSLAIPRRIVREGAPRRYELVVVDVENGAIRTLYATRGEVRSPAWSHDGMRIAFWMPPQLVVVPATGGPVRVLTQLERSTRMVPSSSVPDAAQWSLDDSALAFASMDGTCAHLSIVDVVTGQMRAIDADHCAMRPVWAPDGRSVIAVRVADHERTLWSIPLAHDDEGMALGPVGGVVASYAFDARGSLVIVASPRDAPRGIFRLDVTQGAPLQPLVLRFPAPLRRQDVSIPEQAHVRSADGTDVDLVIFPRTCGDPHTPGPTVLYGRHKGDISPRWYEDFQYLAALGVTTIAVNTRGAPGRGRAYLDLDRDGAGKGDDMEAALQAAIARPDVDEKAIALMFQSVGADVGYDALARSPGSYRAAIDWVGIAPELSSLSAHVAPDTWPPMLWLSAGRDIELTRQRHALAAALQARGFVIDDEEIADTGHNCREEEARTRILARIAHFLADKLPGMCAP